MTGNLIMRRPIRVFVLTLFGCLAMSSVYAACDKPAVPACTIATVPFANDKDADDCRKEMLGFRDAMDRHASCLGSTSPSDEKAARDEYEDIRDRFNKRARGEF
jgi:hypothetical protein